MAFSNPKYHNNHPFIGKIVQLKEDCYRFYKEHHYTHYYLIVLKVYDLAGDTIAWCEIYQKRPGMSSVKGRELEKQRKARVNIGIKDIFPIEDITNEKSKALLDKEW